jgi:hypothetical protein
LAMCHGAFLHHNLLVSQYLARKPFKRVEQIRSHLFASPNEQTRLAEHAS